MIGGTPLPAAVPHLNRRENFFTGGGVAAGGGAADGSWNFLAGPDYTCPNYLANEVIKLVVDGVPHPLVVDVHRARDTGIFFGITNIGELQVCLMDHSTFGEPWVARLVMIQNQSGNVAHEVGVQAWVSPIISPGGSAAIITDGARQTAGGVLTLDTSLKCARSFCQNWANRHALIAFDEPAAGTTNGYGDYVLTAKTSQLADGGSYSAALYHYTHYDDQSDRDCLRLIQDRNPVADAEASLRQWQAWFKEVPPRCALDHIKEGPAVTEIGRTPASSVHPLFLPGGRSAWTRTKSGPTNT